MAFFSGSTSVIYRQFSITIVTSMVLSVVVALTLTPALCADAEHACPGRAPPAVVACDFSLPRGRARPRTPARPGAAPRHAPAHAGQAPGPGVCRGPLELLEAG
jgi:hypothetical protein